MFHNVKTKDGTEIHSIPVDMGNGDWKESSDHILSKNCHCSPIKLDYVRPIYGDYYGEIYNHRRPQMEAK
jgi:hypothetical protein